MMEPLEIEDAFIENKRPSRNPKLRHYVKQIQHVLFSDKMEHYAFILLTVGFILIGIGLATNFFVYTIFSPISALFWLHITFFFVFTAISGGLILHLMHHQHINDGRPKTDEEVVKLLTIRLDSEVTVKSIPKNPSTIWSSYRFRIAAIASIWALELIMVLALVYFNWNPATIQKIRFNLV